MEGEKILHKMEIGNQKPIFKNGVLKLNLEKIRSLKVHLSIVFNFDRK